MIFKASQQTSDNIYSKLLSDKLPADLGYLYENAVTQMVTARRCFLSDERCEKVFG